MAKQPSKLDALGRRAPPNVPALPKKLLTTGKAGWSSRAMRDAAATDYITDADGHDVRWHHERKDRLYSQTVGWKAFEMWSINEKWKERRRLFWEQIEERVRMHMSDRILRARLDDMQRFEQLITHFDGYLMPLKDAKTGKIKLNDETGLPLFALEMPPIDKFMGMYLKLHERVMLLRGEATTRTETVRDAPVDAHQRMMLAPKISHEDAKALARTLLEQRMLLSAPSKTATVVETEGEMVEAKHDAVPHSKPRSGNGHKGNGATGT